ncbi:MAG: hypothetical protein EOO07_18150 [Chitinophagaceae bacterium]|nr:MAG: hypothetical protein EOO07_18150 [Chitinophagaceae bacterium]
MKKILLICLLAYLAPAFAQEKTDKLSKSIEDRNFAFVVENIRTKGTGYIFNPGPSLYTEVNPSTMSPAASERLTSKLDRDGMAIVPEKQEYYAQIPGNGSYLPAGYFKSGNQFVDTVKSQAVYLLQDYDELRISTIENPTSTNEINNGSLLAFTKDAYKIKSLKKKKKGYSIVYVLKDGRDTRKLYLNIDNDGTAVLQGEPKGQTTTYFYGKVLPLIKT